MNVHVPINRQLDEMTEVSEKLQESFQLYRRLA